MHHIKRWHFGFLGMVLLFLSPLAEPMTDLFTLIVITGVGLLVYFIMAFLLGYEVD